MRSKCCQDWYEVIVLPAVSFPNLADKVTRLLRVIVGTIKYPS